MHFQKTVDFLHRCAAALGDADLALGVDQGGLFPLLGGHRPDHRVRMDQRFVAGAAIGHRRPRLLEARQHAPQPPTPAPSPELGQWGPTDTGRAARRERWYDYVRSPAVSGDYKN